MTLRKGCYTSTMTHQWLDTPEFWTLFPSSNATTGGLTWSSLSPTMWRVVLNAKQTKWTHTSHDLPSTQSNHKTPFLLKQSPLTSSPNSLSLGALTPYSPLPTMTAPRQCCSSLVGKKSMDQEWPNSTLDTYSLTMNYLERLSPIKTLDLHPTSCVNCASNLTSNRTSALLITPKQMGN